MPSNNSVPKHLILCFFHQLSARSVPLSSALFQCPFATMFAWRWRISSSPLRVLQERASSRLGFEQQFRIKGSDKHLEPPCPHHCGGRRQPRSRLDISADSFCSAPSAPSLRLQCLRYADEARDDSDAAIRAARRSLFLGPTFPVLAVRLSRSLLLEAAQHICERLSLPSSRLLCLPLCRLRPKGRSTR